MSETELMTGTDPYREGDWTEPEPKRAPTLAQIAQGMIPAHIREAAARAREIEASLPQPAWTVHVSYVDAHGVAEEDRIGDGYPRVENGALIVEVFDGDRVTFHAGWSLRHVHTWFVDYTENDDAR